MCENKFSKAISTNFADSNLSIFSPKSPPNSPNTELAMEDDLKGVYINDTTYKVRSTCFSHIKLELFFLAVNTLKVHKLKMKFKVHLNIMYPIYSLYNKGLFIINRYNNYFT